MKTYVLSLPDDTARRSALFAQFPNRAKEFEIVEAIDGRKEKPAFHQPLCRFDQKRPLTSSEIACTLGHLRIYEKIIAQDDHSGAFYLILEDDVLGTPKHMQRISQIAPSFPKKSLVILGGQQGMYRAKHLYGYPFQHQEVFRTPRIQRRNLVRTACYLVDAEMASHLHRQHQQCLTRADHWSWLTRDCDHVYYTPLLAHPVQNHTNSHIEAQRANLYSDMFWQRWQRDGWRETVARITSRALTPIATPFIGLTKIPTK